MNDLKLNTSPFNEADGIGGAIRIEAPEFTHMTDGQQFPHMARLTIEYVPRELVLDGDSVSEYFQTFRDASVTPEEAIHAVCADLSKACEPMMMNVQSQYSPRNAIATNPQARFMHPESQQKQQGPRIVAPH